MKIIVPSCAVCELERFTEEEDGASEIVILADSRAYRLFTDYFERTVITVYYIAFLGYSKILYMKRLISLYVVCEFGDFYVLRDACVRAIPT